MELVKSGRMFDAYGAAMDAALEDKAKDIEPWLVPGLTIDRGCGTGALMNHLAKKGHKIVGVEVSDTLSKGRVGVVMADVLDPVFADGFASNIILSSVLHEVYSYKGYSLYAVAACLANCARELRRGGRLVIRDIWSPEPGGLNDLSLTMEKAVADKLRDYEQKILALRPDDNDLLPWDWDGGATAHMSVRLAVEFLSKKDYNEHWDLEVREIYTGVPMSEIERMAKPLGLRLLEAKPVLNGWIVENRWSRGAQWSWNFGRVGQLFTNQLVVLEKI